MHWVATALILLSILAQGQCVRTFYIDYASGTSSNSGTSKDQPWKKSPFMSGFNGAYSHQPGDRFIFKGGVTWDSAAFPIFVTSGGNSGASDYYGVDKSWYNGNAWTRPKFDGEYSSPYIFSITTPYVELDNLELTRIMVTTNWGPGLISLYCAEHVHMNNLYLHDWDLSPSLTSDDHHGGIIGNYPNPTGCSIDDVWIDNAEIHNMEAATRRQNGMAVRSANVRYSKIHDVATAILFGTVHDSEIYNVGYPSYNEEFDSKAHTNVAYMAQWDGNLGQTTSVAHVYNNYIHDVLSGSGAIYPSPSCGTIYIYNNVVWNNHWNNAVLIDTEWSSAGCGETRIYNNTFQVITGTPAIRLGNRGFVYGTLMVQNNIIIANSSVSYLWNEAGANTVVDTNNVVMTQQAACNKDLLASPFATTPLTPWAVAAAVLCGKQPPVSVSTTAASLQATTTGSVGPAISTGSAQATCPISLAATSGTISTPMQVVDSHIEQNTTTPVVSDSGSATYTFHVNTAGNYTITAFVNAVNGAHNSLFVSIDAQPTDSNVWHIIPTSGFETRTVTWGGNTDPTIGSPNTVQEFPLVAGAHTLIIRGRESLVLVQTIQICSETASGQLTDQMSSAPACAFGTFLTTLIITLLFL